MPQDLPLQQSQQEFQHMAQLQQARARDRQTTENQSDDPADDVGDAELKTPDQPKKISKIIFTVMLVLAIVKDVGLDMLPAAMFQIPTIGQIIYFLAWILGYLLIAIIYIWAWQHKSTKADFLSAEKLFMWLFGTSILESIPFIKDVSTSLIIFVIYVYLKNKKEVKQFEENSLSVSSILKDKKHVQKIISGAKFVAKFIK